MPRTYNNRKSSGRQLSKTELLIQQEQKEQKSALSEQRHREYLARQQRRDNKARKSALRSSGYKPSWQIERERQLAKSKQQVKQTLSFGVLNNEDDDDKSLHQQLREHSKAPKPVKAPVCSGVWARGLAVKPVLKRDVKPAVKPAIKPVVKPVVKPAEKPVVKPAEKPVIKTPPKSTKPASTNAPKKPPRRTGWDSDDDDDDAWPELTSSNWADEDDEL
jgi:hypothetical protein